MLNNLKHDVRYGIRVLRKSPGFTLIAIIALALGVGVNTAIFSVVHALLLRPLPYEDPSRLVFLSERTEQLPGMSVAYLNFLDWKEQNQVFDQLAAFQGVNFNLSGVGDPERLSGRNVTATFFSTLGIKPALGRDFTPEDDRPGAEAAVIITHGLWQRRFGGQTSILGQPLTLNGQSFTVIGVLPAEFRLWGPGDVFASLGRNADTLKDRNNHPGIYGIGRIRKGVTLERAGSEMETIAARLARQYPTSNTGHHIDLTPVLQRILGDVQRALLVLLAAVGFVLLIACVNVANLLLARASARQKEMAIRMALGAGRVRLLRQLLTESVLLAACGGAAGLALGAWSMDLLANLIPDSLSTLQPLRLDLPVLGFTVAVSLLTGIIFGVVPAFHGSRPDLHDALKEGGRHSSVSRSGQRTRRLLVAFEVALALVLLIGAGLMVRSFSRLRTVAPGFDPQNLLTLQMSLPANKYDKPEMRAAFYRQLVERISVLPGVNNVSAVTPLPLSGEGWQFDYYVEGYPVPAEGQYSNSDNFRVTPDYFKTLGIPLVRGRLFTGADNEKAPPVIIVNQAMVRRWWPNEDPIGKRIRPGHADAGNTQPWRTVVGVVGDIRQYGLDQDVKTQAYLPHAQSSLGYMTLVVRPASGDPLALLPAVRSAVQSLDANQPVYNPRTMEQLLDASFNARKITMVLLGLFAALAAVLAGVGIYGVMSYSVEQQTHEIGIRMALGAQHRDVLRMVVRQGMVLVVVGVAVGLLGAFALTRLMANLLYGVRATDPLTFAAVALALAVVAFVANYVPARRATRVDPMIALRYE